MSCYSCSSAGGDPLVLLQSSGSERGTEEWDKQVTTSDMPRAHRRAIAGTFWQ